MLETIQEKKMSELVNEIKDRIKTAMKNKRSTELGDSKSGAW